MANSNILAEVNEVSSRRVFHIAPECYIVYVGRNVEDYRPFVRIGSYADLDSSIQEHISSVVLSDRLTGIPWLEKELFNAYWEDIIYVGDKSIVEPFRNYLSSSKVQVLELADLRREENASANRSFVDYFQSGNVVLQFNHNKLFELFKREERDNHLVSRYKKSKTLHAKNPYSYTTADISKPGIVRINGSLFFFNKGSIYSTSSSDSSFQELFKFGFPIDAVRGLFVNTSEPPLGLVKYCLVNHSELSLYGTKNHSHEDFYRLCRTLSPQIKLFGAENFNNKGIKIEYNQTSWKADLEDFHISTKGRGLVYTDGHIKYKGSEVFIEEGIPYTLVNELKGDAVKKQITSFVQKAKGLFNPSAFKSISAFASAVCSQNGEPAEQYSLIIKNSDASEYQISFLEQLLRNLLSYVRAFDCKGEAFLLECLKGAESKPLPGCRGIVFVNENGVFSFVLPGVGEFGEARLKNYEAVRRELEGTVKTQEFYLGERKRLASLFRELSPRKTKTDSLDTSTAAQTLEESNADSSSNKEDIRLERHQERQRNKKGGSIVPAILIGLLLLAAGLGVADYFFFNIVLSPNMFTQATDSNNSSNVITDSDALNNSAANVLDSIADDSNSTNTENDSADTDNGSVDLNGQESDGPDADSPDSDSSADSNVDNDSNVSSDSSVDSSVDNSADSDVADNAEDSNANTDSSNNAEGNENTSVNATQSKNDPLPLDEADNGLLPSQEFVLDDTDVKTVQELKDDGVLPPNAQVIRVITDGDLQMAITDMDIRDMSNVIALASGYRVLGEYNDVVANPDWIFPEVILTMPDGKKYSVKKGDMIWTLAYNYIRLIISDEISEYRRAVTTKDEKSLEEISQKASISQLRQAAQDALENL